TVACWIIWVRPRMAPTVQNTASSERRPEPPMVSARGGRTESMAAGRTLAHRARSRLRRHRDESALRIPAVLRPEVRLGADRRCDLRGAFADRVVVDRGR